MSEKMIRQLEAVFKEEQKHLLNGDLAKLGRLAARKEHLTATLGQQDLPGETLARIADLSGHNQSLLNAAREGLNSARARLVEIQRGAPMGTYSRLGEKTEFAKPVRTLQRRA